MRITGYLGVFTEKGKPVERQGRKASGLRAIAYDGGAASYILIDALFPALSGPGDLSLSFESVTPFSSKNQ